MINNINEQLLDHFKYGAGAAEYLRRKIPGLVQKLTSFMKARTDIRRLQEGEKLSELILATCYFQDIIKLRSSVATYELLRTIKYKNQNDHTAHTLYLFLLGVWIYDNVPTVNKAINKTIDEPDDVKTKRFLFQWTYASLLHDIGYIFDCFSSGQEKVSSEALGQYDFMFKIDWIKEHLIGDLDDYQINQLETTWKEFTEKYKNWRLVDENDAEDILNRLKNVEWIKDFLPEREKRDAFEWLASDSYDRGGDMLRNYAFRIAQYGYDHSGEPKVDHAIASGLMLFQYTSIWYWLYYKIQELNEDMYTAITKIDKYEGSYFEKHVIPACRATIYHNLKTFEGSAFKPELEQEPLLYLAILCDELQVWDRFGVGENQIRSWSDKVQITAEDVLIDTDLVSNNIVIKLEFINIDENQRTSIRDNLEARLDGWGNIVKLCYR